SSREAADGCPAVGEERDGERPHGGFPLSCAGGTRRFWCLTGARAEAARPSPQRDQELRVKPLRALARARFAPPSCLARSIAASRTAVPRAVPRGPPARGTSTLASSARTARTCGLSGRAARLPPRAAVAARAPCRI